VLIEACSAVCPCTCSVGLALVVIHYLKREYESVFVHHFGSPVRLDYTALVVSFGVAVRFTDCLAAPSLMQTMPIFNIFKVSQNSTHARNGLAGCCMAWVADCRAAMFCAPNAAPNACLPCLAWCRLTFAVRWMPDRLTLLPLFFVCVSVLMVIDPELFPLLDPRRRFHRLLPGMPSFRSLP
jgi:hypothetical protein